MNECSVLGATSRIWGSTTMIAALGLDGVRAPLAFPGATDTATFQVFDPVVRRTFA